MPQISISILDSAEKSADNILEVTYSILIIGLNTYRTKMKIRSENFSRASGVQKEEFPNFSPAPGFFCRGGTKNPIKTAKNR